MGKKRLKLHYYQQKLSIQEGAKAYIELKRQVVREGILDRSYGYYIVLFCFSFAGFFLSLYQLYVLTSFVQLFLWALFFTIFTVQLGALMHDAGHRAIAKSTRVNDFLGYIICLPIAMSYRNWMLRHTAHHAHPNEEEEDTQLDVPILSFTRKRFLQKKGFERFLTKHQAYLFYPLLMLGSFAQRKGDFAFQLGRGFSWKNIEEIVLLGIGLFLWFVLPFLLFDIVKALFVFVLVHLMTGFYINNIFAPNHKGMPQIAKDTKISFLEQQIITARNISNNWLYDFLYGGLNYQIEHHLFPNCPRNKLHRITPYLLNICKKYRLEYTKVGIIESNRAILSELKQITSLSGY